MIRCPSQDWDHYQANEEIANMGDTNETWETFTKRTEDPKLAYIEHRLDEQGIPHRRSGESFHAPILEVPTEHAAAAWALLDEDCDGRRLDDIPDDDPTFGAWRTSF